uniref:Uncharacterized protein n=1 Tax=Arundo donax TaxID=35708 RepID=A0A0A9ELT1_ARUDO
MFLFLTCSVIRFLETINGIGSFLHTR